LSAQFGPPVIAQLKLTETNGRCLVMGVLNVTPDSFSDGGRYLGVADALEQASRMVGEGADILDIGGESTRPGASAVSAAEELERVIPVIERLRIEFDVPISVDTSKAEVMRAAVVAGATMINDVCALQLPGSMEVAAELAVPVCLMHMLGEPRTMQDAPEYEDVVDDVCQFLQKRIDACLAAGIARTRVIVDPGFGFGKTLAHNLALLRNLDRIAALGYPVLAGLSRKSMLGQILDRPVDKRLYGGLAMAILARQKGAAIIRVHDVAETVDALRVLDAVSA
jgi:dihydropteroate synthase